MLEEKGKQMQKQQTNNNSTSVNTNNNNNNTLTATTLITLALSTMNTDSQTSQNTRKNKVHESAGVGGNARNPFKSLPDTGHGSGGITNAIRYIFLIR